jgi:hypothetical protein
MRIAVLVMLSCFVLLAINFTVSAQEAPSEEKTLKECEETAKFTPEWLGEPRHIWNLDFTWEKPETIRVSTEEGETEVYTYMLYKLKNSDSVDHEFNLFIAAWSDKKPCQNSYDEGQERFLTIHDLPYRDKFIPDVKEKIEKTLFKTGANGGKGLYCKKDVTMPAKIGEPTKVGTHGDEYGINSPVIKAGEEWECVAIFDRFDDEMNYFRVYVGGLTNDLKIYTHLDAEKVKDYIGVDIVHLRNGEIVRGEVEETTDKIIVKVKLETGDIQKQVFKREEVKNFWKAKRSAISPNERLYVEKFLEITFHRPGDEFYTSLHWMEFEGRKWVEWVRVEKVDLVHNPIPLER